MATVKIDVVNGADEDFRHGVGLHGLNVEAVHEGGEHPEVELSGDRDNLERFLSNNGYEDSLGDITD